MKKIILTKTLIMILLFSFIFNCSKTKKNEFPNIDILKSRESFYLNSIAYGIKDEIKNQNIDVNIDEYNLETGNLSIYEIANKIKSKKDIIIALGDNALNLSIEAFPTNPIIASGIIDSKTLDLLINSKKENGNVSGVYYIADVSLYIEDLLKIFNIKTLGYVEYKGFKYANIIKERLSFGARLNKIKYNTYTVNDILNVRDELKLRRGSIDAIVVLNNVPIQSVYEYTIEESYKQNIPVISFEPLTDFAKPILYSVSPNYYRMGRETADIAIKLLGGESIEQIEIVNMSSNSSLEIIVNKDIAKKLGIAFDENAIEMIASKVIEDGTIKSIVK